MTLAHPPTAYSVPARAARFARVLPLAFITYSLAYLDRVNIGFGGAGGMRDTLHFTEQQFTWFNSSFFIGYVLFQIPGTSYAARHTVKKPMFFALLFWGIIASATAVLNMVSAHLASLVCIVLQAVHGSQQVQDAVRGSMTFWLLVSDRFLLGAVEGLVFPSLLIFLTHWFTKRERSRANTLLILGNPLTMLWASLASGSLVALFDRHPVLGLRGWQFMLLAEGAPTLIWAVIWWKLADDKPADARWLARDSAIEVQAALDAEQADVKQIKHYWAAFRDPQVLLLCLQFCAWSVAINGFNFWLPVIIKHESSLGMARLGLINSIPYLFGVIAMMTVASLSDRLLVRKPFVWPFLFIGAGAFLCAYLAGAGHFWILFGGLVVAATCMYAPYGPFWAMMPEMLSRNVIGESVALINTIGALGGFLGTFGVGRLKESTGGYGASFISMSVCLAVSALLTLGIRVPSKRTSAARRR